VLAVDWLGWGLTAGALLLLLRGRRRLPRALLATVLGELGRVLLVALLGGRLLALTAGGAFTRMQVDGLPYLLAQLGGLQAGALLGVVFGRQVARDTFLYACLCSVFILLLLTREVGF
jgi:hypothetical protein